jgi:cytochrome c-type biogenesis protein
MIFFFISFIAGILTVLAPCILPLLPIIIGASDGSKHYISRRALRVIGALSISIIIFTLILKASTLLIDIPQSFWNYFSGIVLISLGIVTVFPDIWAKIPIIEKLHTSSNKNLGSGYTKNNAWGDFIVGFSLGPVFSTCSPTYLFILATVLPASLGEGLFYLIGFTAGLALSLLVIAYLGQQITNKVSTNQNATDKIKKVFGILFIIVGVLIMTGYDKKIETWILDSGYGATIQFEENLIQRVTN